MYWNARVPLQVWRVVNLWKRLIERFVRIIIWILLFLLCCNNLPNVEWTFTTILRSIWKPRNLILCQQCDETNVLLISYSLLFSKLLNTWFYFKFIQYATFFWVYSIHDFFEYIQYAIFFWSIFNTLLFFWSLFNSLLFSNLFNTLLFFDINLIRKFYPNLFITQILTNWNKKKWTKINDKIIK